MKEKKLLIFSTVVLAVGILVFAAVFIVAGGGITARGESRPEKAVKTVIIPASNKFQTNLKGAKSIISMSVHLEVIEDKKLLKTIEQRDPEARSKVLDILRDKTVEDTEGTIGKKSLEKEIVGCYRSLYGDTNIISVYIDDFVTQ